MFKDTCTVGKMLRSNHGILSPSIPSVMGGQGYKLLVNKRGHLFISQHSFIKKKKKAWGKFDLCFLVELRFLAQAAWSFLFLSGFSIRLVLTHSINQAPHSLKA